MTNENEQPQDAEFPETGELVAEESEDQPAALPAPERSKRKSGAGIAWLALFLALISAAGVGYMVVQDWRARGDTEQSASSVAQLRNQLASSSDAMQNLDAGLARLAAADEQAADRLRALRDDLEQRVQLLDSLPSRMSNLENAVAAVQGISTGARNTLLLAEAEYYMQLANAQLQLAGNPELAALALGMADDRVVQLADPALTDVRRALADELAALDIMEIPDIEGVTLTLSSLAGVVATLPLRQVRVDAVEQAASAGEEQSGVDRAWESVKRAASGLVRVTSPDETAAPLLTPDAEYFLRTNLTLQLQVARLALLRGEQAVFEQSLADADAWLQDYFDTDSAQVRGARATIEEIRSAMLVVSPPDISGSLQLLRQFNSISGPAQ
ncbi:MAG: uroporphyrinogen-III C-methyltransferase [Gammaproteobacteria bacterium]|nr:uroporphyrinogen-III C-methyltransferase [Gammaproteobacteria bacterium]